LGQEAYATGSVVLVPFPFTDLSGRKRRPALVVSPEGFHDEDLILCAITSQLPQRPSEWEAPLEAEDMVEEKLPKKSIVKVGKLFTMHRDLIARRFGTLKEHKLQEVLYKLRGLFGHPTGITGAVSEGPEAEGDLRTEEVDEAVLALLHLNAFDDHGQPRAWKTFDWDAMDRLHEKGLISDPKSKAKSVALTDEGRSAVEHAFRKKFGP
jgi:mRNA-degrading endonuclease toxin of MazEF toxin-antitoxin module